MIEARRRDSATKREIVRCTVDRMLDQGTPITFATVARHARVSNWLVYAPGVRELIDAARDQQRTHPGTPSANPHAIAAPAALATDLALARAEIQRLHTERPNTSSSYGAPSAPRLDTLAKADLTTRVDELTRANTELPPPSPSPTPRTRRCTAGSSSSKTTSPPRAPACAA